MGKNTYIKEGSAFMRKGFILFAGIGLLFCGLMNPCFAQFAPTVEIPSSFNPVGSGARALGMGSAFIAVADDATAASWNPGGLIQLELPEISIVGAYFRRREDNSFGTNPDMTGMQEISGENLNYLSVSYPFVLFNHNMIMSLNYQRLYDFTREWAFVIGNSSATLSLPLDYDYSQSGELTSTGFAYCIQMTPSLSFGFTLNFWDDWLGDCGWKQKYDRNGTGWWNPAGTVYPLIYTDPRVDEYTFEGFNVNLGCLWNVNSKLTVGAVFKSPFTADLEHEYAYSTYLEAVGFGVIQNTVQPLTKVDEEMDMPMSYGIGVAYRFSDQLTVSADVFRTEWQDFVLIDENGNKTSPISRMDIDDSDVEATNQVRIGGEYLFIKQKYIIPLRGGAFYDPAPSEKGKDKFYGVTLGTGIAYGKFIFDIAYQYRFANDVGESILQSRDFSQDVDEHTFYTSVIYHF